MPERLPRWVWVGAGLLAAMAGMVNAVGFLSFGHRGITHLTGTTTMLGEALMGEHWRTTFEFGLLTLSFVAGCALSGLIVGESELDRGRRYGIPLLLESLLLFAAIPLIQREQLSGMLLASAACGLQNAMATSFSGATIRTTHLSGMFTDLGIAIGHLLRGIPLKHKRLTLSLLIIGAFFGGACAGAFAFAAWRAAALAIPAGVVGAMALFYMVRWRRIPA